MSPTSDYSVPLRVWHWSNALLISGQLLTILFIKVVVNARALIPAFQQVLAQGGGQLSQNQGRQLAHLVSDRIWDWHIVTGLILVAFWVLRLLLEVRGPAERRFTTRFALVLHNFRQAAPAERGAKGEALFAKSTYLAFYLMLAVMAVTGVLLTWADDYESLHRIEHTVKEIHEVTMYLIIGFSLVHIVGVVWAELTKDHGLISRMVGGK